MRRFENTMRVRTTAELSALLHGVGGLVMLCLIIALFFVKSFGGALIIISFLILCAIALLIIAFKAKKQLMMNTIDTNGVKNESFGKVVCKLEWQEIGDFGVAPVENGIHKGRYIYMSRIFVSNSIREDILRRYDPRICVVLPYTEEICFALRESSAEKIDIK